MAGEPFVIDAALTAMAVNYHNPDVTLIADQVMPRVDVGDQLYEYDYFPPEEVFTVPDTTIGRRGAPNEVEFSAEERTAKVVDRGLDSTVPERDIAAAKAQKRNKRSSYDPEARAVEGLTQLVQLDRELRVAGVVQSSANYAGNTQTLAGTSQWSDYDNSDPLTDVSDACDSTFIARPNIAVMGRKVFTKLSMHPVLVEGVMATGAKRGKITRQQMADLFELDEVLVGDSFFNTARKGQVGAYDRVWGKFFALLHRNRAAQNKGTQPTWGFTAEWRANGGSKAMVAGRFKNPKGGGLLGGTTVRAGEFVEEHVMAPQTGFLFENAIL